MSTYNGRTVTVLEQIGLTGSIPSTTAMVADIAATNTAVGVLVTDGASPTQAHVTTLNGLWTTLKADWATLLAAVAASQSGEGMNTLYMDSIIKNSDNSYSKVRASDIS